MGTQIKIQSPILIICIHIIVTTFYTIYRNRIHISASCTTIRSKHAEHTSVSRLRLINILLTAKKLCTFSVCMSCQITPVMRIGITVETLFPKPITIPMTQRDLIHMVIRLGTIKQF